MKGSKTIAQVCGTRWNRLMCPTWAAAYVGYTLPSFRENAELSALIFILDGKECVDREDLDAWVDAKKEAALKAKMEMSASAAQ